MSRSVSLIQKRHNLPGIHLCVGNVSRRSVLWNVISSDTARWIFRQRVYSLRSNKDGRGMSSVALAVVTFGVCLATLLVAVFGGEVIHRLVRLHLLDKPSGED